ncbi:hypothetical protein ABFV05_007542 [Capra hircus]
MGERQGCDGLLQDSLHGRLSGLASGFYGVLGANAEDLGIADHGTSYSAAHGHSQQAHHLDPPQFHHNCLPVLSPFQEQVLGPRNHSGGAQLTTGKSLVITPNPGHFLTETHSPAGRASRRAVPRAQHLGPGPLFRARPASALQRRLSEAAGRASPEPGPRGVGLRFERASHTENPKTKPRGEFRNFCGCELQPQPERNLTLAEPAGEDRVPPIAGAGCGEYEPRTGPHKCSVFSRHPEATNLEPAGLSHLRGGCRAGDG